MESRFGQAAYVIPRQIQNLQRSPQPLEGQRRHKVKATKSYVQFANLAGSKRFVCDLFQRISIQIGDVDHVEVHKRTSWQRSNSIVFEVQNVEGESNGRLGWFCLGRRWWRCEGLLASGVLFVVVVVGLFTAARNNSFDDCRWCCVDWLDDVLDEIVGDVEDSQLLEWGDRNVGDLGEDIVGKYKLSKQNMRKFYRIVVYEELIYMYIINLMQSGHSVAENVCINNGNIIAT